MSRDNFETTEKKLINEARRQVHGDASRIATGLGAEIDGTDSSHDQSFLHPSSIAGYKLVREIHRGGQGVVYQALQRSTKREVAVKFLKEGTFATYPDRARFEREIQVLGQLKHPNIVGVHDSGVIDGHEYFVMDFISGQPLDAWIAAGDSVKETLKLFAKICDAVNAAHVKGIIHRDLKPGNIRIDHQCAPHILDFGLAKIAISDEEAPMTLTGQFMGSLPWSSPEQAEGRPDKIDLRTDVYALGVVLYQMLTGKFPYEVIGSMHDVLDRIINEEPQRPSATRTAINDEVDTIVLKCLDKDRARRYQSAGELARDINHYLAGEPIEAKRDSTFYVLGKQIRKYRIPVCVAGAFFVVVVSLSIALAISGARATRAAESTQASQAFLVDMLASVDPFQRRLLAGMKADWEFPGAGFTVQASGRDVSVLEMIETASNHIKDRFTDQPELEAMAHETVGTTFLSLWRYDDAIDHLRSAHRLRRQALGNDAPDTLRSGLKLALALWEARTGKLDEADELARDTLAGMRRRFGPLDPKTLSAQRVLADVLAARRSFSESNALYQDTLDAQKAILGPDDRDTLYTRYRMACTYIWQGKLAQGDEQIRDLHAASQRVLGPDDSITVASGGMAGLYACVVGRPKQGLAMLREGYENCTRVLGADHPHAYLMLRFVGQCLMGESNWTEKEQILGDALNGLRSTVGDAHTESLISMYHLAALYRNQERLDEAVDMYRLGTEICARTCNVGNRRGALFMNKLARTLREDGRLDEAVEFASKSIATHRQWTQRPAPTSLDLYEYGWLLLTCEPAELRDPRAALPVARESVRVFEESGGNTVYWGNPGYAYDALALAHFSLGETQQAVAAQEEAIGTLAPDAINYRMFFQVKLAYFLRQMNDEAAANAIIEPIRERVRAQHGERQAEIADKMLELSTTLLSLEEYRAYSDHSRELTKVTQGRVPSSPRQFTGPVVRLARILIAEGRYLDARALLLACRDIERQALSPDDWRTARTRSLLGDALFHLDRPAEAEPLLVAGYHEMNPPAEWSVYRDRALERLLAFFEATGRPDDAAQLSEYKDEGTERPDPKRGVTLGERLKQ
ncbi:MAG: protein kinase domain-containing protein [Planctomycetota bacterium]|jgi:tetratricopeptide (TPR) repeat protein/predicted Ser/Thr protein kinase